jgi:hypothetical protein
MKISPMPLLASLLLSMIPATGLVGTASADAILADNDAALSIDCAEDPEVSVLGNHITLTLTGTCTKVSVSGNHATVTGSTATLWVAGNHTTATLTAVDAVFVAGNHNTVTYAGTVTRTLKAPKVSSPGTGNKITKRR